jgi:DNA-binding Lrp family transcriptional regulator
MARPDRKLFRLLNDDVCRDVVDSLLGKDGPLTQAELTERLGLNSGTVSRRVGHLEDEGIVEQVGKRYRLVFAEQTRKVMQETGELTLLLSARQHEDAKESQDERRKQGMAGGHLQDRAGEQA